MVGLVLHADAVWNELVLHQQSLVLVALELGEAPLVRDVDLLTARKFEFGTTQRLDHHRLVLILGSHRHDRLADVDAGHGAQRLAEGASHASLKTIGAGARQHFIDAKYVERVDAHADVEGVLAAVLY